MDAVWHIPVVVLLALLVDLAAGDPPTAVHPVGWMGRIIDGFRRFFAGRNLPDGRAFLAGVGFIAGGILLTALIFGLIEFGIARLSVFLYLPAAALILKGSLSFRSLVKAAGSVGRSLMNGDLPEARRLLGRHLVSRPVDELDEARVASAAIESASENFADSVVALLFWFFLAGLPGAWIYRFADTADSILGYRDAEREWLGKAAARTDDFLCRIPARLAGWILAAAAVPARLNSREALRVMRRDAHRTPSPNSGRPMAAAAGALDLRLEKPDSYVLNDGVREPDPADINAAIRLLRWGLVLTALLFTIAHVLLYMMLRRRV